MFLNLDTMKTSTSRIPQSASYSLWNNSYHEKIMPGVQSRFTPNFLFCLVEQFWTILSHFFYMTTFQMLENYYHFSSQTHLLQAKPIWCLQLFSLSPSPPFRPFIILIALFCKGTILPISCLKCSVWSNQCRIKEQRLLLCGWFPCIPSLPVDFVNPCGLLALIDRPILSFPKVEQPD